MPVQYVTGSQLPYPRPNPPATRVRRPPGPFVKPFKRPSQIRDANVLLPSRAEIVNATTISGWGDPADDSMPWASRRYGITRASRCCWSGQQLVNTQAEDTFEQPCRCRTHLAERATIRTASGGQPLKVSNPERAGLVVLAGERLGVLHELFERLPSLPDLLFEHSTEDPHRCVLLPGHVMPMSSTCRAQVAPADRKLMKA